MQEVYYSKESGDDNDTIERIIYQSFNVGKWSGKLNSETTILSRIFMAEPTLLFLPSSEKERVAGVLIKDDTFIQAMSEYNKIITYSNDFSETLLDDLISMLGSIGVEQLNQTQVSKSSSILYSKILKSKSINKYEKTLPNSENKDDIFQAFNGMWFDYDKSLDNLKVYSRTSLWYSLQSQENYGKGFWDDLGTSSLIAPKMGFVTGEDLQIIKNLKSPISGAVVNSIGLTDINNNLVNGKSSEVILYRNNPNSWSDLPQIMNTMSVVQIVFETAVGAGNLFKPKKVTEAVVKLKNMIPNPKTVKFVWAVLKASVSLNNLTCELSNKQSGISCDETGNMSELLNAFEGMVSISGGSPLDTWNEEQYARDVLELMNGIVTFPIKKGENISAYALDNAPAILITNLVIIPLAKASNTNISTSDAYIFSKMLLSKGSVNESKFNKILVMLGKSYKDNPKVFEDLLLGIQGFNAITNLTLSAEKLGKDISKMETMEIVYLVVDKILVNTADNIASSVATNLLKAVTPAKYVDLIMSANKGGAMAYDWMTDPSVVRLTIKKNKDSIDIDHSIPPMKAIRFLRVPVDNDLIVSRKIPTKSIVQEYKGTRVISLGAGEQDNHFLVMKDFYFAVENQTAFHDNDKDTINSLLDEGKVKIGVHSKEFASSKDIRPINREERVNCSSQKELCTKPTVIKNPFLWNQDSIKWADEEHPIEKAVIGNDISNYNMIDFSEFLKKQAGTTGTFLVNKVGVESFYTETEFKTDIAEKLFTNTINFYVLPNFKTREEILQADAVIANSPSLLNRNYELQLKFKSENSWNLISSLNMVLKYKVNGKERYSKVIKIGEINGNETKVYPLPKYEDVYDMEVIIFDDTLDAYAKHSGKGLRHTLRMAEYYRNNNGKNPIIVLNTKTMKRSEQLLLTPIDTDKDGVADIFDAFPNKKEYQYDSDKDGIPDKWEEANGLNMYQASDAKEDFDKDNVTNLSEFEHNGNPKKDDTDGDGISDSLEIKYGFNVAVNDANEDADKDNVSNIDELIDGTNPLDKEDVLKELLPLKVTVKATSNTSIKLTWETPTRPIDDISYCISTEHISDSDVISCKLENAVTNKNDIDLGSTEVEVNGLLEGKKYYIRMRVIDFRSNRDYPNAQDFETTSDEISIQLEGKNIPKDAKEINLCANQTAYLENKYTLGMSLNTQSITGRVFEKSEDFTGAAFCGEFAGTTSSEEVLNNLRNSFSDANNVVSKNNSDGSLKVTYEMIGENVQAYSRLLAKLFGIGDFSPEQDEAKAIGS